MNTISLLKRCAYSSTLGESKYYSEIDLVFVPTKIFPYVTIHQTFESFHRLLTATPLKHIRRIAAGVIYDALADIHESKGKAWNSRKHDLIFWSKIRDTFHKVLEEAEESFVNYMTIKFFESNRIDFPFPDEHPNLSSLESLASTAQAKRVNNQEGKLTQEINRLLKESGDIQLNIIAMWSALAIEIPALEPDLDFANLENELQKNCYDALWVKTAGMQKFIEKFSEIIPSIPEGDRWRSEIALQQHRPDTIKLFLNNGLENKLLGSLARVLHSHWNIKFPESRLCHMMFLLSQELDSEIKSIIADMLKNGGAINLLQAMASLQNTTFILNPDASLLCEPNRFAKLCREITGDKSIAKLCQEIIGYEQIWNKLNDLPGRLENYKEAPEMILNGPHKALEETRYIIKTG